MSAASSQTCFAIICRLRDSCLVTIHRIDHVHRNQTSQPGREYRIGRRRSTSWSSEGDTSSQGSGPARSRNRQGHDAESPARTPARSPRSTSAKGDTVKVGAPLIEIEPPTATKPRRSGAARRSQAGRARSEAPQKPRPRQPKPKPRTNRSRTSRSAAEDAAPKPKPSRRSRRRKPPQARRARSQQPADEADDDEPGDGTRCRRPVRPCAGSPASWASICAASPHRRRRPHHRRGRARRRPRDERARRPRRAARRHAARRSRRPTTTAAVRIEKMSRMRQDDRPQHGPSRTRRSRSSRTSTTPTSPSSRTCASEQGRLRRARHQAHDDAVPDQGGRLGAQAASDGQRLGRHGERPDHLQGVREHRHRRRHRARPGRARAARRRPQEHPANRPGAGRAGRHGPRRQVHARRPAAAARSRSATWARSAARTRTPIINPPEVAILLVGRSRKLPVVVDDADRSRG